MRRCCSRRGAPIRTGSTWVRSGRAGLGCRSCSPCGPRDWGLAHLDELATAAHRATGVSTPECRDYFAGLDYAFTDRHLAGLGTFFRKLAAHGLAPAASLRYLEVA